jgi:hypothetical protein
LQTTLTPPQEAGAVALRKAIPLPLGDLLAVVREVPNPHGSRSGPDRCLRRHGAGKLRALKPKEPRPAQASFRACEPGCLHIDIRYLPLMADEDRRRNLFVAIDRATRWVFVRIDPAQTAAAARRGPWAHRRGPRHRAAGRCRDRCGSSPGPGLVSGSPSGLNRPAPLSDPSDEHM